jgi:hypothetical protein
MPGRRETVLECRGTLGLMNESVKSIFRKACFMISPRAMNEVQGWHERLGRDHL